jgi:glutathione S-transferase
MRRSRAMAAEEGLALYQFMSCPFCAHVRSAADELGLEIELRDIHAAPEYAEELRAAMGRSTVPVLRIAEGDGEPRWLPESTDIISYLQQRFA